MLSEQTSNQMLKLALVEIRDEVRQGRSLAVYEKHPKIFNNLYVSMIEVSEAGNMDQVLARLEYTVKMVALQQKSLQPSHIQH